MRTTIEAAKVLECRCNGLTSCSIDFELQRGDVFFSQKGTADDDGSVSE